MHCAIHLLVDFSLRMAHRAGLGTRFSAWPHYSQRPSHALGPDGPTIRTLARSRLAEGFSLDEAAHAAGASKRTLARRMEKVMGKSPLSYFQDLRVEHAVHLLKTSDQSIEEIATQVGYSEGVTLRTLLRRHLAQGIREIRRGLDN
jgi:transcriptional regulator GlxA family with amidase domain